MAESKRGSNHDLNEQLNKRDLEIILEVNKKAIEIETSVADQNEEMITLLNEAKDKHKELDSKIDRITKLSEELNKDIFKLQVLLVTGLLSLVMQVIQMIIKR